MKPLKTLKRIVGLNLLISLGAFSLNVNAQIEPDVSNVEAFIQAGTKKSGEKWMARIPKNYYEQINAGRKLLGQNTETYKTVHSEVYFNRSYFADYLKILKSEFKEETKHEPSTDELYLYWKLGKDFKKFSFDPAKIKDDETLKNLQLFRMLSVAMRPVDSPLPTDGRRPMPYHVNLEKKDQPRR